MDGLKRTPLYDTHLKHGGKIVDFGGWALPVQYTGIREEHESVRNSAGLFDVSHMGEIRVRGAGASDFIQRLVTNDITSMVEGKVLYSPMCNDEGGTVDDLLIYRLASDDYLLVVNASNIEKDFEWMQQHMIDQVELLNQSDQTALIALQGPRTFDILKKLVAEDDLNLKYYHFNEGVEVAGARCLLSRTGYTGEDGAELYIRPDQAEKLWEQLLEAGEEFGICCAGLGARDTLRFEAAMPLYGHELSETISPLEAGLGFFVKLDKEDFIGKEALAAQKKEGLKRKRIGFEMVDRGISREHYKVLAKGREIGFVSSGSFAPTLKKNLGMALVDKDFAIIGQEIDIEIRGKALKAVVIPTPFYKRQTK